MSNETPFVAPPLYNPITRETSVTVHFDGSTRAVIDGPGAERFAHLAVSAAAMLTTLDTLGAWLVAPDLSKETIAEMRELARAAIAQARGQ